MRQTASSLNLGKESGIRVFHPLCRIAGDVTVGGKRRDRCSHQQSMILTRLNVATGEP